MGEWWQQALGALASLTLPSHTLRACCLRAQVEEIHLSFTIFLTTLNARLYFPNEKLRIQPFINLSSSGNKGESFKVGQRALAACTPPPPRRLAAGRQAPTHGCGLASSPLTPTPTPCLHTQQVLVDLSTPAALLDALRVAAEGVVKVGVRWVWGGPQAERTPTLAHLTSHALLTLPRVDPARPPTRPPPTSFRAWCR